MRVELIGGPNDGDVVDVPVYRREIIVKVISPEGWIEVWPKSCQPRSRCGIYRAPRHRVHNEFYWDGEE